jgi:hypothetical protein
LIGVGFAVTVFAEAGPGTCNALADVNMATSGHHSKMISVVIT